MRSSRPILLVDDDIVDVKTVKRAFREHKLSNPLISCEHGEDALDFLRRDQPYIEHASQPLPALILLDLNMPVMNGLEFLQVIKSEPTWRAIPCVVLTSSAEQSDLVASYGLGVAGYIVKPVEFAKLVEAIKTIDLYWTLCESPPGG